MMKKLTLALVTGLAFAAPATAKTRPAPEPVIGQEAKIPFVNVRGIRSFHAEDDDIVYLQDYRRRWYRAELNGPCYGLPWAMRVAVDARGSSTFDRDGVLLVGDERCMISSLTHSGPPPRKASKRNRRAAG